MTETLVEKEEARCSCPFNAHKKKKGTTGEFLQLYRHHSRRREELSCSPFLLEDRDKMFSPWFPAEGETEKTNDWNCANTCSTTPLKYLSLLESFFLRLVRLSSSSCLSHPPCNGITSAQQSLRKGEKSCRRRVGLRKNSAITLVPVGFVIILSGIIPFSVGSPVSSTQLAPFGHQGDSNIDKRSVSLEYIVNNDSSSEITYDYHLRDGVPRRSPGGHRNLNGSSSGGNDSSNLKFTFFSGHVPKDTNSNDNYVQTESEKDEARHLQQREAVMRLLQRMKNQPDRPTALYQQQQQYDQVGSLYEDEVTNDLSHHGENISSRSNNSWDEESSGSKSINDDDSKSSNGTSVVAKCWPVVINEGKVKAAASTSFSSASPPIAVLCNGTSQLALAETLHQIPDDLVPQVISIDVKDSSISRLNLSLFHRFPRLESLSVTHSNVTLVIGSCPQGLKALNLSFNSVKKLEDSVFPWLVVESEADNDDEDRNIDGGSQGSTRKNFSPISSFTSSAELQNNSELSSLSSSSVSKISTPNRFSSGTAIHSQKSASITRTKKSKSFHTTTSSERWGHSQQTGMDEEESVVSSQSHFKESKSNGEGVAPFEVAEKRNEAYDDVPVEKYNDSRQGSKSRISSDVTGSFSHTYPGCVGDVTKCMSKSQKETQDKHDHLNQNKDSEKSESYSYEDGEMVERQDGDYYHQGALSSFDTALPTSSSSTSSTGNNNRGKENEIKILSAHSKEVTTNKRKSTTADLFRSFLQDIDLSHNKISEVPTAVLRLNSLKSLRLSGNQLKCDFVWEKLADWYMKSPDPNILKDGDDTFCGVVDDVDVRVFQFTVLGVLKAKKDVVETCRTVDKNICHECGLYSLNKQPGHGYNLSHHSPRGNVAIALKLDCSYQNLTSLPEVPPQTWQLNVSGNFIKDLTPLKEPMYENVLILDADTNEINTLEGLAGTSFLDRYNYLSLQNNRFDEIPTHILSSLKNMRGQGVTFLGANFIDCDCDVVKDIKPLLLENSKKVKDLKEIYCKDMKTPTGDSFVAVKDLQFTDLCYMDTQESNEMYLYLIIFVELLLIFMVVAKVWHDQRTFRRTGILPWCSAKMPRLPCDAMLESVKEPPHFNRSSSTNVRSFACEPPTQSISSHVQLREVRSNSGQSEKSSQISQLSSFPSSSRTSSV